MRTWGRVFNPDGTWTWTEVTTDAQGFNDYVWITALVQVLKLNLGESPFYANYGIPAKQSVIQQIAPDYYVNQTQQQFAQYFANLSIANVTAQQTTGQAPVPTYLINLTTNQGVKMAVSIPV